MGNKNNRSEIKGENEKVIKEERKEIKGDEKKETNEESKKETEEHFPFDKEYIYEITDLIESDIKNEYKIVFLGGISTGAKTALINRLTGVKFEEGNYDGKDFAKINIKINSKKDTLFQLWSTPSHESYVSLIKVFMKYNDCVVIGYDITRHSSFDEVKNLWYPKAIEFQASNLIYLIGNKIDKNEKREVKKEEAIKFAKSKNLRFFEISCKTDEGIKEFFDDLVHSLLKQ